jgi:pimeloyl-ACP methyl ester carboxylesterase
MSSADFKGWPYIVRLPDDYTPDRPVPLIVYLSGGPGLAIQGALVTEPAFATTGYLVVYPHANGLWWDDQPRRMVASLLDEVMREFAVDQNRVYLGGFSNGGTGALYYATLWPHRFAAVASSMAARIGLSVPEGAYPASIGPLPLLLLHGSSDPIIDVSETLGNQARLAREAPATPVEVARLAGRGHDIWPGSDEGRTLRFLEGRVRAPFPRAVTAEMANLKSARRYWIEVLDKAGGVAKVEALITRNNVVEIRSRHIRRIRLLLRPELLPSPGPLRIVINGREAFAGDLPEDCSEFKRTSDEAGDPDLAGTADLVFDIPGAGR